MNSQYKIIASKKIPQESISLGIATATRRLRAVLFLTVVWAVVLYGCTSVVETPTAETAAEPAVTLIEIETPPSSEPITPTYHVLPVFKMNDVLNVEEELRWDGTMALRNEDFNKTYPFYKQCLQNYTEKINLIADDQLNLKSERYYSLSTIKSNTPDTGRTLIKTSLEGKTLGLECKNYQISSCEKLAPKDATIISDDYSYVNSFNWIYFLLPSAGTTLEVGASYPIKNTELGRIIFGEHFDEKSCVISGNGLLEEVTDIKTNKTTARLLITLKIKQTKKDNAVLTVDLIGLCRIPIDSEPALDLEISGPFNITQSSLISEGKKLLSSVDGVLKIKSKITIKNNQEK
ncbi:MAG: hypothetical protein V1871_01415 [Planctomycetota bacterium]